MAVYKYDSKERKARALTDKEIKREIMLNLGLDPKSSEDNKEYRRRYDIIRKRVKNYNNLTSTAEPISANEVLLRITRRQNEGEALTAEQQNILATPAINTNVYARRILNNQDEANKQGRIAFENIFANLLNAYRKGRADYEEFLSAHTIFRYTNKSTGEITTFNIPQNLPDTEYAIEKVIDVTPREVEAKLKEIAKTAHAIQNRVYNANKAYYNYNKRRAGYGE